MFLWGLSGQEKNTGHKSDSAGRANQSLAAIGETQEVLVLGEVTQIHRRA